MSSGCSLVALIAICAAGCRSRAPDYRVVRAIIDRHCVSCHSEHNTSAVFPFAPSGVKFDEPAELRRHAERIRKRVLDGTMPLLNKTEMTDAERALIDRWVEAGAKAP